MYLGDMSEMARDFIFIWLICIFILGLCNLYHSVRVKETMHIVVSSVLLIIEYFLLQILSDISHIQEETDNIGFVYTYGRINLVWWIILIAVIMIVSILLASFFRNWKSEHITPMSVKDSMDMIHAGLCYWEDGGRIILSNRKMDEICLAVSGEMLLNGDKFYNSIESECILMPDGTIKSFFHNLVEFEDKQIHELMAVDVTELYKKNELLKQETISLQKMNESMRRYNQNIEETVRKQEILDAKIYIHDEMNRLMLVTMANTEMTMEDEEFKEILALWRNNAIILGSDSGKKQVNTDISEINKLAELLDIHLSWRGEKPVYMADDIRQVLVMVAREAIANAVKHAGAKNLTIEFHENNEKTTFVISNDGNMPVGKINPGGGLTNIKRIVESKNGCVRLEANERFNMILEFANN